jgi:predicted DNA-binding transcriptional regulator YafY
MGPIVTFPQSVDAQLRFAITHKRLLDLRYNGRSRVVEPHDYGVKNGTIKLLAFQRGEWRWFDVAKIESLAVLERTFAGGRATPHQQHHSWDELYARVAERDPDN